MSIETASPLVPKMPLPVKLAVVVCEIRDGNYWLILKVHQGPHGCVIESGQKAAARCLQVLPQALDVVTQEVAEMESARDRLATMVREAAEALLPYPQAPESTPPDALSPDL